MKVAIPVFQGKVAPRLDCAEEFLILEVGVEGAEERERWECHSDYPLERAVNLAESEADIIICGAIDQCSSRIIAATGKRVYPWQYGEIGLVIRKLLRGELSEIDPAAAEPKCRRCSRLPVRRR